MKYKFVKYLILSLVCYVFFTTLMADVIFSEDFNASNELPEGWTTEQLEASRPADRVWRCDNPGRQSVGGNFSGNFAMYDGSYRGYVSNPNVKAILTTPVIDCSAHSNVTLAYDAYYVHYASDYVAADVLISTDGENWTRLKNYSADFGPALDFYDITELAAGKSNVQIRWSWDAYAFYYGIDNVQLLSFTDQPRPVTMNSPANGADKLPLDTQLRWTPSAMGNQPTGYKVYVDTVNPPETMVYEGEETTYSPTLGYKTTYYWQVVPYNEHGSTATEDCLVYSFTTYPAEPFPVTLELPDDEAEGVMLGSSLEWAANTEGISPTGYKVRLDTENPPRESSEQDVGNVEEWAPGFAPATTFYWQVIPYAADGEADPADCAVRSFTTNPARPYAANLILPADNATQISVAQKLRWVYATEGEEATGSKLFFGTDNPPVTEVYDGVRMEYSPTLEFGETYYWQVVPYNAAGHIDSCPIWTFETAPATVVNLPLSEEFTADTQPDGWQILIDDINPEQWRFSGHLPTANPGALFIGNYASIYRTGATGAINSSLITPAIDCTGIEEVKVGFTSRYTRHNTPAGSANLEVSTDGVNWETIQSWTATHAQSTQTVDISSKAANKSTVYVRCRYQANQATTGVSWWKIDNIFIYGPMPPYAATPTTPADSSENLPNYTWVNWTAPVGGAPQIGYNLYVGTNEELDVEPIDVGNVLRYFLSESDLELDTKYYWQVVPYNAVGETDRADCPIWSFTTRVANPLPVAYIAPINEADNISTSAATLKWARNSEGEPATDYRVYLDKDNPPTTEIYDGPEFECDAGELELSTLYYWRVVPYNDYASTPAEDCPVYTFTSAGPPLEAGTYVVSPDYPEEGDYKTIQNAVDAVVNRGVAGPVVIDIKPGNYTTDSINIDVIPGSSAENTVTLTNTSTEGKVVIDVRVLIDGTSNIRVENLYLVNQIIVENNAQNVEFVNCNFEFTGSDRLILRYSHDLLVESCSITGITNAIYVLGTADEYLTGIVIKNNKFVVTETAIGARYVDSFVISGNIMENVRTSGSSSSRLVTLVHTRGSFLFANNKMFGFAYNAIEWGVRESTTYVGGHESEGKPSYFVNNMIGGGPGSKFYNAAVSLVLVRAPIHDVHFYYNSFNMDYVGTSYGSTTLTLPNTCTGLHFLNNSFAYTGGDSRSVCFSAANPETMIEAMDYNNFYSNGSAAFVNYGGTRSTLAEIQAVDGRNQNSRVGDPQYISAIDLHSFGTQLWKAGVPIDAFTTDIDGDDRDGSNPCIGADEYQALIDHDLAAIAFEGPEMITAGEVAEFEITVLNNGRVWQSDYTVKLMKEGGTELASIEATEAIFEGDEVKHVIEWIPEEKDMFKVYGLVVLEGDQLPYNDATEMHSIFIKELAHLNAPVVTLTVDDKEDYGTLSWDAVPGAKSYIVYGSYTIDGPWIQLKVTDDLYVSSPLVSEYGQMAFFRVVASSEPKTILLETPRIQRDAEIKKDNR